MCRGCESSHAVVLLFCRPPRRCRMISIDARGLRHPHHINAFRDELAGLCEVFEDVEILFDNLPEERKKLEMFIRSCRATYSVELSSEGHLRIFVQQPFSLCG